MSKKISVVILVILVAMILGVAIIVENKDKMPSKDEVEKIVDSVNQDKQKVDENKVITSSSKILIAYFSRNGENYAVGNIDVGNTEVIANYIKDISHADVFKIEPKVAYPTSYDECVEVARQEKESNARPEILNTIENIQDYDVIFLGYPIWHQDMPMIIYSFLEMYDLSGKTIIPFVTHEGSGNSGTYDLIRQIETQANVLDGVAIRGQDATTSKNIIEQWLKELGL